MPYLSKVNTKTEVTVEQLDGGLNAKNGPSLIDLTESPDCLNVTYGDLGSVQTREGTSYYNSSAIASATGDGIVNYNQTMVVFTGGSLYRMSGTTGVIVTAASGKFLSGSYVAYEIYQNMLICSDGTNGPYRYEGDNSFYNLGIAIPSAPTAASNGAGDIAAGTYYYAVSYINSHAVEGEYGSASTGTTIAASASIAVTGIPTASGLDGVAKRYIYRASTTTATYYFVKELSDNTTTSFTDNVGIAAVGAAGITDGTAPTPFTTVKAHKERLWFDDSANRSILRYTEFSNPFVSKALNVQALNEGGYENITAIGVQDDLVCSFKDGNNIYLTTLTDPSDDTTIQTLKSPANVGIVGPRAFEETDNGIFFVAKRNGRIVGVQLLSGLTTIQTTDQFLRTRNISEKIEAVLFDSPKAQWSKMSMFSYDNRIYLAFPYVEATRNNYILWFDVNRLTDDGQPGSWSLWDGDIGATDFCVFDGNLYGAWSDSSGKILRFNNGTYTDASGAAINSYWWSKQIGGERAIESWTKDFRFIKVWHQKIGSYNMNVKVRIDGEQGTGTLYPIDLTPTTSSYGTSTWGYSYYAEGSRAFEKEVAVGPKLGKRIQVGFDNQDTAGQGFNVHSFKVLLNLRRQR